MVDSHTMKSNGVFTPAPMPCLRSKRGIIAGGSVNGVGLKNKKIATEPN